MKRKLIASLIIGSMLLMPTAVLADEDKNLYQLSFENIKTEMKNRSPVIQSSWDQIHDGYSDIGSRLEDLKGLKESVEGSLNKAKEALAGLPKPPENGDDSDSAGDSGTGGGSGSGGDSGFDLPVLPGASTALELYYEATIFSLETTLITLNQSIEAMESQRDNLWKSYIQVEQLENQLIQGVQSMFLSYFNLVDQRDSLADSIKMLENQLKVSKISQSLGLATNFDTLKLETQLKEQNNMLKEMDKALETMIGNINLMLGQDYDVDLTLLKPKELRESLIKDIDYDKDLEEALKLSYDVRLADNHDDREQAKREFTFAFYQVYENLRNKLKAIELAEEKLENERAIYDVNYLKYSLGLMSKLEFEGNRLAYRSQAKEVEKAKRELLQAYTDYEWMKKGQKVSISGGTASSAGTGGMGSGMGSSMGSGMGGSMGSGMGGNMGPGMGGSMGSGMGFGM